MPGCIDLFAGAGGAAEGFRQAGFAGLCAVDSDENAARTFAFNHPDEPVVAGDIRRIGVRDLLDACGAGTDDADVLEGGPPCQGFSLAGRRMADDPRNALFREYLRLAEALRPKAVFFENVPGIMSMQGGRVVEALSGEFRRMGYACAHAVVNAADFGAPQMRMRFILLAVRGLDREVSFPKPTHGDPRLPGFAAGGLKPWTTAGEALAGLPPVDQGEGAEEAAWDGACSGYAAERRGRRMPGTLFCHRAIRHKPFVQERYALIPQGGSIADLPPEMRTKKRCVFRIDPSRPARTVTCCFRTDMIHPAMPRGLTAREAARLQTFDDDYRFFGSITRKTKWLTQDDQIGNAVPPLLAKAFASHVKDVLLAQF